MISTMDSTPLFTAALGLQDPWKVDEIRFEPEQGEIHFDLACDAKRLGCPVCAAGDQSIHDRTQRTWQHLHFFQFKAFLHAPLPRVKCAQCGKVTQVEVPWARPGSGFTLLMDALVLTLATKLPVSAIAQMFGVSENRIWQAIDVHVESARQATTYSEVRALGVDEKYVGRRLGYLSIFTDQRCYIASAYRASIVNPLVRQLASPEEAAAHVYHLYVVTCSQRERLQDYLQSHCIQVLIHYPIPVHAQAPCRSLQRDPNGLNISERDASECLSLPCNPQMTDDDIAKVIETVNLFKAP